MNFSVIFDQCCTELIILRFNKFFYSKMCELVLNELVRLNNVLMKHSLKKYYDGLREQYEFEFMYPEIVALHDDFYAEE